ncbi:MAG: FecR domain-containing protein [Gammaproteobacteria bacterium]|nr:FecR domain-containing protein [Gammaproteobacteria bacterium]
MNTYTHSGQGQKLAISVSVALGLLLLFTPVQAEVINNSHWLVRSGDTVYSIARAMYPGDTKQQIRFRRELVKANPQAFAGNSSYMNAGSKLVLPQFAQQKPESRIPRVAQKAITPDPQDIIGKVVINIGDLQASNRSATRRLSRHSEILSGDTLKTSKNARAQIRLKDGALIALQPDTEFKIEQYNFNGQEDGTERGIYELIKGGFRTITGLIGHRNKQNYKVRTTVATIGIRGTHYGLMLCEASSCAANNLADGLYGGVVDGSVAVNNGTGEQLFNNDQYFHVASAETTPIETLVPPPVFDGTLAQTSTSTSTDAQRLAESQVGVQTPTVLLESSATDPLRVLNTTDNTNQTFAIATQGLQAPTGAGTLIAFNHLNSAGNNGVSSFIRAGGNDQILLRLPPSQAAEVPFSLHEEAVNPSVQGFNTHDLLVSSTAQLNDFGTNQALNVIWGRWTGDFSATEDNVALQTKDNLHFVYSENLTPLANLGGLTSTTLYSSFVTGSGGTLPTDTSGGVGTQTSTFNITMNFASSQMTQYTVTAPTTNMNIATINAGATTAIPFSQLNGFAISDLGTTCDGGGALCTGNASVAFVGTGAEAVLTSYTLASPDGAIAVSGAGLALAATPPQ